MSIVNPTTNISYTNKDFETIYPELLDLVSKLSLTWNPSISNESDAGVVLLKVMALMGDKVNYNIDKNILETFPTSVTQDKNAWALFEQLGYNMHWLLSGTTDVSFKYIGEDEGTTVNIPRFTMVSDIETEHIYTLITPLIFTTGEDTNKAFTVPAIQGIATKFEVNGETLITPQYIDDKNRVYFAESNIAENGIFINNSGYENYDEWVKVDNLSVQALNTKCYKFGVDISTGNCYIEFPSDYSTLFDAGINITYIKSDGQNGNIAPYVIEQFYNLGETDVELNTDTYRLANLSAVQNGQNSETIEDAYKAYKKTIGVFNTLNSLADYTNYITSSKIVSNGFVTDRTCDIQDSYYIVTDDLTGISGKRLVVAENSGTPKMLPFDLKMYLTQYVPTIDTKTNFDKTFDVASVKPLQSVLSYIDLVKNVQHNFVDIESNRLVMLKNKYPISVKIIPQYTLTELQMSEIRENIKTSLYNYLNANNIEFGQQITFDDVYDIITNSDERIKAIVLDDLTYSTVAVYYDGTNFIEIDFNEIDLNNKDLMNEMYAKSVLAGHTQLLQPDKTFNYSVEQSSNGIIENIRALDTNVDITLFAPSDQSSTSANYTLKENENIQFYAPNLIDMNEYSNYIKYEYVNTADPTSTLAKDVDHMLLSTESVVLYWKTEDSEDAYYHYAKYTAGSILKPSFVIEQGTNYGATLPQGEGVITDPTLNAHIANDVEQLLTATRTLTYREINNNVLDNAYNYCYWITNKTVTINGATKYQLFTDTTDEYILQSGEYFIFTNAGYSELNILGSGTKITRNRIGLTPCEPWYVDTIDYSNILSEGISAFSDESWKVFRGADVTLDVTEMQFINLGKGTELLVTRTDTTKPLAFNNSGLVYNTSVLADFNITYRLVGSTTYEYLPSIVNSSIAWNGRSVLDVSMSSESAQNLYVNQSIVAHLVDGTSETLTGTGTTVADCLRIIPNVTLDLSGGIGIPTDITDINGNVSYLKLYSFNLATRSDETNVKFMASGNVDVVFTTSTTYDITFMLPVGDYLLPLVNNTNVLSHLTLKGGHTNTAQATLFDITETESDFSAQKMHYIKLSITDDGVPYKLSVVITRASGSSSQKITLKNAIKYTVPTEVVYADIMDKIRELDTDNIFDYSYEVAEADLVENPFIATSYFSDDHIYNKYCICQLSDLSISIINR